MTALERGGYLAHARSVVFSGSLTVREPEALTVALREGLGSAKGFGFGLLSLAG